MAAKLICILAVLVYVVHPTVSAISHLVGTCFIKMWNLISGVMVSVLVSSAVDRGFEP